MNIKRHLSTKQSGSAQLRLAQGQGRTRQYSTSRAGITQGRTTSNITGWHYPGPKQRAAQAGTRARAAQRSGGAAQAGTKARAAQRSVGRSSGWHKARAARGKIQHHGLALPRAEKTSNITGWHYPGPKQQAAQAGTKARAAQRSGGAAAHAGTRPGPHNEAGDCCLPRLAKSTPPV